MAYTKQNWECGDLITADKMNHIEDGIEDASSGGGSLIVTVTSRTATAEECSGGGYVEEYSHSWQEIYDALASGTPCYYGYVYEGIAALEPIVGAEIESNLYKVICIEATDNEVSSASLRFDSATSKKHTTCNA